MELLEQLEDEVGEVIVATHRDDILDRVEHAAQEAVDREGDAADDEEGAAVVALRATLLEPVLLDGLASLGIAVQVARGTTQISCKHPRILTQNSARM